MGHSLTIILYLSHRHYYRLLSNAMYVMLYHVPYLIQTKVNKIEFIKLKLIKT